MKKRLIAVMLIVIAIAVILVIVYGIRPREASAPGPAGNPVSPASSGTNASPSFSIIFIEENASSSPTISVKYPRFPTLPESFNADIASSTLSRLADFRQEAADNAKARHDTSHGEADIPASSYSFMATWETTRIDSRYVSGIERYDSYTGGANENQDLQTFNFDIAKGKAVGLGDLFPGVKDYLQQIARASKAMLSKHFAEVDPEYKDTIGMLDDGTAPTIDNFKDFTFTDDSVTFYFPKYAVAPGSWGEQKVTILRGEIK